MSYNHAVSGVLHSMTVHHAARHSSKTQMQSHLLEGSQLVVLHHLGEAELQVAEQATQLILVGLLELGVL